MPPPEPYPVRGQVSFWYADAGLPRTRRPPVSGDLSADVAIIGAGFTGLWAAWYLKRADPALNIVIIEREFAGFGASGRNGGWLTGGFAWSQARYARRAGPGPVRDLAEALAGSVDEIIGMAEAEGIEADILRTEELTVATNPAQLSRLKAEIAHRRDWGEGARLSELSAADVSARIRIPGALGGMALSGVARIQPALLVQGLARAVERSGVRIAESSEVISYAPGEVVTALGRVRAPVILRATEGFTAGLAGFRRDWLPLNSAQIATEPLPSAIWDEIGWQGHELLGDFAHAYCYCQRSREGRLVVGGRGIPYRFGSATDRGGIPDAATTGQLRDILRRLFPAAGAARIDHAWCGVLAVPRDWCASVAFDPATGHGHAGGYVGVGVSTSNLAGRTLVDLVLRRDSDLTRLPWVNRPVRRWEPEPLRWVALRSLYGLYRLADRREARLGLTETSGLARIASRLAGR